jgi:flavin-dependent dehydrogenase
VAVVGGGPAGACAASTLAGLGLSTLLLETRQAPHRKTGETLAAPAGHLLQALGIWDEFSAGGHLPCHGSVSAWGQDRCQQNDFLLQGLGSAWQLDRAVFEESLIGAAARAGATIVRGNELTEIARENGGWRFHAGGRTFRAGYGIDATGRRSMMARKRGARRITLDRLVAVQSVVDCRNGSDRDSRIFIESCPDGWWYSALLPGGRRIVSLQTDADLLPRPLSRTREWLVRRFGQTRSLSSLLRKLGCELTGSARLTSAHSGRLQQFSGEGWIAVGDAAMSFDPLSGHGILNAMRSGIRAAQTVVSDCARSRAEMDRWYERFWEEFLRRRRAYYAMEQRWCDAPFWRRRILTQGGGL